MIPRVTVISDCTRYRYTLWREWDAAMPYLNIVGLNPSTADATEDDATIRRCRNFARDLGYGALCMTNLFAWRDTDKEAMMRVPAPVGPDNDRWLAACAAEAGMVIVAWGTDGGHLGRDEQVHLLLSRHIQHQLQCLGTNKDCSPKHPLYLRGTSRPSPWPF